MTKAAAKKLYEKTGKFPKIVVIRPNDAYHIWQMLFIYSLTHPFTYLFPSDIM